MESPLEGPLGLIIAAWLGLSVGSFANVLVYRVPREGLSVLRPLRSFCPTCSRQLTWSDNIPVLAWMFLRGRCRGCQQSISWRYPAVELLVGALFVLLWWLGPPVDTDSAVRLAVGLVLATTCVVVSAIDLELLIIPDAITFPGMALGLLLSLCLPVLHEGHAGFDPGRPYASALVLSVGGLVVGGGSLWVFGLLGNLMLRRQVQQAGVADAMGLGDVKWMAATGTLLGPMGVGDAILGACFVGALVGIGWKLIARVRGTPPPGGIPFGPFLSMGILAQLVQPGVAWSLLNGLAPVGA